jgi:PPOX class probable FMN-dependent enzyme
MPAFDALIETEQELRALLGEPGPRAVQKERTSLDDHCRAYIAQAPFVLVGTSGADGRCDVSPKGDAPGFVRVLDDHRLIVPDRPGNRRLDGMRNLLVNPRVGLLFLVPGREETLRVNGRGVLTRDPALLALCATEGKTPLVAIGVQVEECFMHCAKAFKRSNLWVPASWPSPDALPSMACVLFDQIKPPGLAVEDYERDLEASYRTLY